MSAKDYINSIPIKYEQYTDPAVELPMVLNGKWLNPNKGKKGKQKQRKKALKKMCQERGHFSMTASDAVHPKSFHMTRKISEK